LLPFPPSSPGFDLNKVEEFKQRIKLLSDKAADIEKLRKGIRVEDRIRRREPQEEEVLDLLRNMELSTGTLAWEMKNFIIINSGGVEVALE
jgi:hypothetical protein